jgi:UDP-N-acetyl-D-glucosamine/UDP-N-acetyl-D-galactosamine dehydrogenase
MQGNETIAIIGLGYVGLPLAVEFAGTRRVIGFDKNPERIAELRAGRDSTLEVEPEELAAAKGLEFTVDPERLREATIYIVTVPTPIDSARKPDLAPLLRASETIGAVLKPGDIVIYESTVYPGATEEMCVPVLERVSGLSYFSASSRARHAPTGAIPDDVGATLGRESVPDRGFYVGYSPERINPGDREHRLPSIRKVTSGSTPEIAERVDALYREIITAGTHKASSIRVAEAAKVIENTQRDVNIALINELALIFNRLGIDTEEVLQAAGTKWNFLPFRPGLVGGHCIGVDPYYLTHKAQQIGYHPEMILAGRRINDGMGAYVAGQLVKAMLKKRIQVEGSRVLVMGLTFKENCPDLRNTRVVDILRELAEYDVRVDVCDPWASVDEARREYGIELTRGPAPGTYDAIVLAVAHRQFREMPAEAIRALGKPRHVVYDLKYLLRADESDLRL